MKFNLNKKMLTASAVLVLAVGVIVYVIAFAATVNCPGAGVPPIVCGAAEGTTVNADTIIASAVGSAITDQAGNDIIYGSNAVDIVPCAAAADCVGDDFMDLRGGADVVGDVAGVTTCTNQANVLGNDFILGGREDALDGADTLCGGPGNDYLFGAAGGDTLAGFADNDVIVPGTGTDTVCDTSTIGGAGPGSTSTCASATMVGAGAGDDVIIIYAGDVPTGGAEYLACGTGNDVFIFVGFSALPATIVAPDGVVGDVDAAVTDPITGGVYNIANDGANPCTLTN
jgi:Ca2+-binding RTX toxin-like protein